MPTSPPDSDIASTVVRSVRMSAPRAPVRLNPVARSSKPRAVRNSRNDTNGATIRDLLGHRSGIPDYAGTVNLSADPLRVWTPAELLAAIPAQRTAPSVESEYGNINYLLLGVVIEAVTGRPMAKVLRDGVLGIDGGGAPDLSTG